MKPIIFGNIVRPSLKDILRLLENDKGTATARSSTDYTNWVTNLYPESGVKRNSRIHRFKVGFTIVSASNIADTYNMLVIPKGWTHVQTVLVGNAFSASAGVGCTVQVGDADDDDRYCAISDFDANNAVTILAAAGMYYTVSADTIMVAKIGTAAAVVGKVAAGFTDLIAPG